MASATDDSVDLTLEISESGEILAVSRAARRRLAAAAGRWRLVPSPPGVVLLSRVDDTGAKTGGKVALAGEVSGPGVLADVINFIHFNQWDGALSVVADASRRTLAFAKGQLLGAASNLPEDRLGAMLVRFGLVSAVQLAESVREVTPQRRLGSVLVERGYMSSTDLFDGVRRQAEEIFYAVLLQRRGSFFVIKEGEPIAAVRLHLDTQALLLEGLRRIDEMTYFRDKLPGPDVVLVHRGPPPDTLAHDVLAVYGLIDGRRTLVEISREAKLGEFAATKAAFELLQRGCAAVRAATALPRGRNTIPPSGSTALVDAYNVALTRIHAACGAAGKPATVKDGVTAFIAGSDRFASLFAGTHIGDDGSLPGPTLVANARKLPGESGMNLLTDALQELVVFVLFLAEGSIDRGAEQAVHEQLAKTLAHLTPPA